MIRTFQSCLKNSFFQSYFPFVYRKHQLRPLGILKCHNVRVKFCENRSGVSESKWMVDTSTHREHAYVLSVPTYLCLKCTYLLLFSAIN
jgi:hypothetical protein